MIIVLVILSLVLLLFFLQMFIESDFFGSFLNRLSGAKDPAERAFDGSSSRRPASGSGSVLPGATSAGRETVKTVSAGGVRITRPLSGFKVFPGQKIKVTVDTMGGCEPDTVIVGTSLGHFEVLGAPPFACSFVVPADAAGIMSILAGGKDSFNRIFQDEVRITVVTRQRPGQV